MSVSKELQNFCLEMLNALALPEDKRPEWFSFGAGICYNAFRYDREHRTGLNNELTRIFHVSSEGDRDLAMYPFNDGNDFSYLSESHSYTVYENEKRMAFLKHNAAKVIVWSPTF